MMGSDWNFKSPNCCFLCSEVVAEECKQAGAEVTGAMYRVVPDSFPCCGLGPVPGEEERVYPAVPFPSSVGAGERLDTYLSPEACLQDSDQQEEAVSKGHIWVASLGQVSMLPASCWGSQIIAA